MDNKEFIKKERLSKLYFGVGWIIASAALILTWGKSSEELAVMDNTPIFASMVGIGMGLIFYGMIVRDSNISKKEGKVRQWEGNYFDKDNFIQLHKAGRILILFIVLFILGAYIWEKYF